MKEAVIRGCIVGVGVLIQILLSIFIYLFLIDKIFIIHFLFLFIQTIFIVYFIKYSKNYSQTLPLIILLLFFPLLGTLICLIVVQNKNKSKLLKNIVESEKENKKYFIHNGSEDLKKKSHLRYLTNYAGFPMTKRNNISYFSLGELAFNSMLENLEKAKEFIFLEYFIICPGTMWNKILEVLKRKVKEGVEVRVIYDDAGCIATLNKNYDKELEKMGIKCIIFNKLHPISGVIMNNRDHRKILVIDGKVAFSGGINLADEYININSPYGHWKDNGIKVEGEAVWSYTVMFLTMWNAFKKDDSDFNKYKKEDYKKIKENGIAIPYAETPLDNDQTGEDIYLNIINQAHEYVYIFTPYLIIDTDVINALILASKRGVDVRLIIPGIPDKKIVYTLSESYLEMLIKGGVKIYKYTKGFVHGKVFISDDKIATVGTINLDFRSLYLHFECGLYLEDVDCIKEIKKDFVETLKESHQVTEKEATPKFFKSIWQAILRLFAPLM
ncbi:MAG: cardiolipin synthase [Bacilli bacterium]|nr:cardiolipin synthase [Bacilli bacterium]